MHVGGGAEQRTRHRSECKTSLGKEGNSFFNKPDSLIYYLSAENQCFMWLKGNKQGFKAIMHQMGF